MANINALGLSGGDFARANQDDTFIVPGSLQVNSGIIDGNGSVITLISENLVVSDKTLRLGGLEMADATYTYVDSTGVVTVAATGHGYASGSTHFVLIIDPADPDDIKEGVYEITYVDDDTFTFTLSGGDKLGGDVGSATAIKFSTSSPSAASTANGSGLVIAQDSTQDISFFYDSDDGWTSTEDLNLASGKAFSINGTDVLTSSAVLGIASSDIVTLTGIQTLTNKTLTSPVISSITNTGTITLPTTTDTLVGRATTDTLTNKTLTTPVIQFIHDSNGNEVVQFANPGSAVNFVKIEGNTTTNGARITTDGGDDDVDLNLAAKGDGKVKYQDQEIATLGDVEAYNTGMVVLAGENIAQGDLIAPDANGKLVKVTDSSNKFVLVAAFAEDRSVLGDGTDPMFAIRTGQIINIGTGNGFSQGDQLFIKTSDGSLTNDDTTVTSGELLSLGFVAKVDGTDGDLLYFQPVHKLSL